jgi:cellulose synthase/poly-beta-1,6-N-acetylglucosamine synthase-like glycosyltransferase
LPEHFDVIVVPAGLPQTKPRALNYALEFVRGAHVAVYDAEDIPDPDQLIRAASVFAASEENLACLQAELTFYNPNENWLTRQFTAEYAVLFGLVLPALSAYGLPLPLGGTSNHFRTDLLRQAGGWDAFNVTEDADLGIRLARLGYRTATLCSRTHEEANVALGNWMRQRVRWLKGFIQTWLVHMRHPARLAEELGMPGFLAVQGMIAGVFLSALLHPVLLALTVHDVMGGSLFPERTSVTPAVLAGLGLAVLLLGYGAMIAVACMALRRIGIARWWPVLLSMPAYWLLISAAGWLALVEFALKPFRWNKTEHGLSALQRAPAYSNAGIGAGR